MLQVSCILKVAQSTGIPTLYAADNVKAVRQTDAGGWIIDVPKAPEGYAWVPNVNAMNPRALANGTNITVLAGPEEIEIATDDAPLGDVSLYISASLAPILPTLTVLSPTADERERSDLTGRSGPATPFSQTMMGVGRRE